MGNCILKRNELNILRPKLSSFGKMFRFASKPHLVHQHHSYSNMDASFSFGLILNRIKKYNIKQKLRARLGSRKTGLSPPVF